jgi:hypothetical protein
VRRADREERAAADAKGVAQALEERGDLLLHLAHISGVRVDLRARASSAYICIYNSDLQQRLKLSDTAVG